MRYTLRGDNEKYVFILPPWILIESLQMSHLGSSQNDDDAQTIKIVDT